MADGFKFQEWLQDTIFKPLEDKKMPVMEHFVELQVRLTRAVIVTAVIFIGTFFYADMLVKWIRVPLQNMFVPGSLSWDADRSPDRTVCLPRARRGSVAKRKGRGTVCPRVGHSLYPVGDLAFRRSGAACSGAEICRAVRQFEHLGLLRSGSCFHFSLSCRLR